ncbi:uncharacterized protein RSE6_11859 [Rhynchosporium secalis]|uniref:Uncharacterized protein n=1 Tax=Rhynchosporium secalis TaxID=38038 RepID=A0A1E1MNY1_RHYSE|nr:uncharacterized protein RSE6_11859 [Rhynchosporium secalis]
MCSALLSSALLCSALLSILRAYNAKLASEERWIAWSGVDRLNTVTTSTSKGLLNEPGTGTDCMKSRNDRLSQPSLAQPSPAQPITNKYDMTWHERHPIMAQQPNLQVVLLNVLDAHMQKGSQGKKAPALVIKVDSLKVNLWLVRFCLVRKKGFEGSDDQKLCIRRPL